MPRPADVLRDIDAIHAAAIECCRHLYAYGNKPDDTPNWPAGGFDAEALAAAVAEGDRLLTESLLVKYFRPVALPTLERLPGGGRGIHYCGETASVVHGMPLEIAKQLLKAIAGTGYMPRITQPDIKRLRKAVRNERAAIQLRTETATSNGKTGKKPTTPGDATLLIEDMFLTHHGYKPGRVGSYDAIDSRKLVSKTSKGSVARFFKQHFTNHRAYLAVCQRGQAAPKLEQVLRKLHDGKHLRGMGRNRDAADDK